MTEREEALADADSARNPASYDEYGTWKPAIDWARVLTQHDICNELADVGRI